MSEIIPKNNIAINVLVKNWQQALTKAGELLVNNGYTTEQYTLDMIQAVNEFGPYIVIAPGIALGHARPTKNVLKTGLSLIVLKAPIEFGSKENDPVQVVLGLCAINDVDHLQTLTQICAFLDQDNAMQILINSQSTANIAAAINNFKS